MVKQVVSKPSSPAAAQKPARYTIERHKRAWAVFDYKGELICLTVYKRGAVEVVRRLQT